MTLVSLFVMGADILPLGCAGADLIGALDGIVKLRTCAGQSRTYQGDIIV